MLTNCRGSSAIEVLVSFSLIILTVTYLIPTLMKTYQERTVIDYKMEALLLLHNEKESFLYDEDYRIRGEIQSGSRRYQLIMNHEGPLVKICMKWEVPWDKNGKICNYVKTISQK